MKLAIHGTKDGYRILYTTNDEFGRTISRDIRKGAQGDDQLGKTAYSLAFIDNGCAYSKYVIVKDSLRSFATGTIAFSLFVDVHEMLKAEDIFKCLNELYDTYEAKYIRNYYLNRGEKELVREDWSFVMDILRNYKTTTDTKRHEDIHSGLSDPAFIYYQDEKELLEYFDKPFQTEFRNYSQILLIQKGLQGKANPINVLKNSGIELQNIDLKNEPFYLINYDPSKRITITANNKPRSEAKTNNIVRAKDIVEISYTKDDQCYYPIYAKGTLFDPLINKYFEIKNGDIIIKWDAFERPDPKTKAIIFEIKNSKEIPLENFDIQIGNQSWLNIQGQKFEYTFKGEELKKPITISSRKDSFSGQVTITPVNENGNVTLILKERKTIEFDIQSEDSLIVKNFRISINNTSQVTIVDNKKIEFNDDAIYKDFRFTVAADGYESKTDTLCPRNTDSPVLIKLKKSIQKRYYLEGYPHGTPSATYSCYSDGHDIKITMKTKNYIFKKWLLDESRQRADYDGILVAQYEKKKSVFQKPKFIAGSIGGVIIVGLSIWTLFSLFGEDIPEQPDQLQQPTVENISAYVEGNSLILDTLKSFKNILGIEQNKLSAKLDSAIKKRGFINTWNLFELKNFFYYPAQQKFKAAIEKVDSVRYSGIKNRLGDISSMSLDRIADSIIVNLNLVKPATENAQKLNEETTAEITEVQKGKDSKLKRAIVQPAKAEQKKEEKLVSQPEKIDRVTEIISYLRGDELRKDVLDKYFKDAGDNVNIKKSIHLCLKFWGLDGSKKNSYSSFQLEINEDKILQNSFLKSFVDDMCKKKEPLYPQKVGGVPAGITNTLQKLKSKMRNENN